MPAVMFEDALIDDRHAGPHRRDGARRIFTPLALGRPIGNGGNSAAMLFLESRQPRLFMLQAFAGQQISLRVSGPCQVAHVRPALQLDQVLAFQKMIQVTRREEQLITDALHGSPVFARTRACGGGAPLPARSTVVEKELAA